MAVQWVEMKAAWKVGQRADVKAGWTVESSVALLAAT